MVLYRDTRRRRRNSFSLNRAFAAAASANPPRLLPLEDHETETSRILKTNNVAAEKIVQSKEIVEESRSLHNTDESSREEESQTIILLVQDDDERDIKAPLEGQPESKETTTPQNMTTNGSCTTFPKLGHNLPTIPETNSADENTTEDTSSVDKIDTSMEESSSKECTLITPQTDQDKYSLLAEDQQELTKDSLRFHYVYEKILNMVYNAKKLECRRDNNSPQEVDNTSTSHENLLLVSKISDLTEDEGNSLSYSESDVSGTNPTAQTNTDQTTSYRDDSFPIPASNKDRSSVQKFDWDMSIDVLWDEHDEKEMPGWNTSDAASKSLPPVPPEIDNDLFSTSTLTSTLGMSKATSSVMHNTEDSNTDWSTIDSTTIDTRRTTTDEPSFMDSNDGSAFDVAVHNVSMIDSLARQSSSLWDVSCLCTNWNPPSLPWKHLCIK
jgi:hypothetical protein